eukprot:6774990-Pyramimonas_sp.AAC.1
MLASACALWAEFRVGPTLEYLGCTVGPAAVNEEQWAAPVAKLEHRAAALARSHADTDANISLYHERALSVLSYKSQLYEIP